MTEPVVTASPEKSRTSGYPDDLRVPIAAIKQQERRIHRLLCDRLLEWPTDQPLHATVPVRPSVDTQHPPD